MDGIPPEFYKNANLIVPYLEILFNTVLDSGTFPDSWNVGMIIPLYKKGDVYDPNNYRGISLLNIMGKIFTSILECRIRTWLELNEVIHECQAGFRNNYSTVDNMFVLQSLCQKYLRKPKHRFYAAFIDFRKAFDFVNRNKLLYILLSKGVHGKMFRVLKDMYSKVSACVSVGGMKTKIFNTSCGVRQGCMLSPVLFLFFINELVEEMSKCGLRGIFVRDEMNDIMLLLFADDVTLLDDTVIGLQKKLDMLKCYCDKWNLEVNLDKSCIVVFRNGGYLRKTEKWIYDGINMKVVFHYKYLGIIISSRLILSKACETLALQAKKASFPVLHLLKNVLLSHSK